MNTGVPGDEARLVLMSEVDFNGRSLADMPAVGRSLFFVVIAVNAGAGEQDCDTR